MGGMTEADDDSLHGATHPTLWTIARSQSIGELARMVLQMRQSKSKGHAAVNSTMMVEVAAEHRRPAEIAELVAEFNDQSGAQDLARLALDAAAARRATEALAGLAGELVTYGLPAQACMLLAAVVRRRLPRDIARLLALLEANEQNELARRLIDELAHDDGRVLTGLWLRALGHADLADRVSRRLTEILAPADLAEFIMGLCAYHDAGGGAAIRGALGRDAHTVAETIGCLHARADERQGDTVSLAREFVRAAVHELDGVDLFVLAGWLSTGAWKEGADVIWAEIVPGMAGTELVDKLREFAERSGPPDALLDGLRKAASLCSVEDVAVLAVEAEGKIRAEVDGEVRNGQQIVLDTVAGRRPVADVFSMAQNLDDRGHGRVTVDLLRRVEQIVHKREEGAEAAQFIDQMLDRGDKQEPRNRVPFRGRGDRWQPAPVLRNVVSEKKPRQLMALIAELTRRRRYDTCRSSVERAVAEHYDGALLAELPLVLGHDCQPAVLHIMLTAFGTPKWTEPSDLPAIVLALKEAGASTQDLHGLLTSTGGKRRNTDANDVVTAFRKKKLSDEADWVFDGMRRPPAEPHFLP
jgi:hypothetical protein